jgi:hypothetical protein
MGTNRHTSWLRLVMDIFLVIAVVIAVGAYLRPSTASAQLPGQTQVAPAQNSPGFSGADQPAPPVQDTVSITNTVNLDPKILAAIIGAENAALSQPQYLISMPVIIR